MPRITMSRATDPINDIGSPINFQYLQYAMSGSPFLMSDASISEITSPVSAPVTMPPKRTQHQQQQIQARPQQRGPPSLVVSSSSPGGAMAGEAMSSTAAANAMAISNALRSPQLATTPYVGNTPLLMDTQVLSPALAAATTGGEALATGGAGAGAGGSPLPGFFHPAEVFTTPETRTLPDPIVETQPTPELALFEDADAIGSASTGGGVACALSPRTQTAQAGLSLLAASATYARRDVASLTPEMAFSPLQQQHQQHNQQHQHNQQQQLPRGVALPPTSPFLTTRGENATLMSQPHNSLAHNLSPRLVDHGGVRGMAAGVAGGGAQAVQGQTHRPGGYAAQGPMFSSSSSAAAAAAAGPLLAKTSATAGGAMHHGGLLQQQQQQQQSSSGGGPPVP
ncbi:hypothetical protein EV177_009624, partial [Coemansia sp. RSA 1804]